jgi:hypothetical protein
VLQSYANIRMELHTVDLFMAHSNFGTMFYPGEKCRETVVILVGTGCAESVGREVARFSGHSAISRVWKAETSR